MIDRYTTPEMKRLWSEANRYRAWLRVELAATRAWEALGEVPAGTTDGLREALEAHPLDDTFAERVAEIEAETRHDIVAFTRALTERVGEDAKYIHLGLTLEPTWWIRRRIFCYEMRFRVHPGRCERAFVTRCETRPSSTSTPLASGAPTGFTPSR